MSAPLPDKGFIDSCVRPRVAWSSSFRSYRLSDLKPSTLTMPASGVSMFSLSFLSFGKRSFNFSSRFFISLRFLFRRSCAVLTFNPRFSRALF